MSRYHDETLQTLQLLGHGDVLDEIHDAIHEVENAVALTGKDGSITLKIKIKANGGKKRRIIGEVTYKAPKEPARETYCFVSDQGQYVENDPDQRDLPLNVAQITKPELREAPVKKAATH